MRYVPSDDALTVDQAQRAPAGRHPRLLPGEQIGSPDPDISRWLRGRRVFPGNSVSLLVDGAETYPAMLQAIREAQRSISLETYIFAPDATGIVFRDALADAARRGVDVRVMVDGVGSVGTTYAFWDPFKDAGGQVHYYDPLAPWRWAPARSWGIWKRNHRKLLVVDDAIGFVGGINISDDYAPLDWGGGAWHDIHARVEGPVVLEFLRLFNREWRKLTGERRAVRAPTIATAGDTTLQVLESAITRRYSVRRAYLHAIDTAQHTVRICNAYFIPDGRFRRALHQALQRGVRVQLLVAGTTDVMPVRYASRALYGRFLRWGAEIYEWYDRVLHAKTAVIDGTWCTIGSYNIDRRSLLHNYEANIAGVDTSLGAAMDAQFERDIARSVRIDPARWHQRPPLQKLLEQLFFRLRHFL